MTAKRKKQPELTFPRVGEMWVGIGRDDGELAPRKVIFVDDRGSRIVRVWFEGYAERHPEYGDPSAPRPLGTPPGEWWKHPDAHIAYGTRYHIW